MTQTKNSTKTHPLSDAMGDLVQASHGKMNFRGKSYSTVALRVEMIRKHYLTDIAIRTRIIERNEKLVVMEARIYIKGEDGWRMVANGYAEEVRGASPVNKTSALENCETSAIGRALASLGVGGGEFASADELVGAVTQPDPDAMTAEDRKALCQQVADENADAVTLIKEGIAEGDLVKAAEAWFELEDDEKQALWLAPSKGGVLSSEERAVMKTSEFRQSFYGNEDK